jgi:hypothetical protein
MLTTDNLPLALRFVEEAISNVRTVKSFAAELLENERYDAKVHAAYLLARKLGTQRLPSLAHAIMLALLRTVTMSHSFRRRQVLCSVCSLPL